MKRCHRNLAASALFFSLGISSAAAGKGLDSLQADTPPVSETPIPATPAAEASTPQPALEAPAPTPTPNIPPVVTEPKTAYSPLGPSPASNTAAQIQPGLQKFYLSSGLSWVNLSSSKGGWHSSTMGDIEAGYKIMNIFPKLDLFSTFRYRPISADVVSEQRAYRAIVESYLFGSKAILLLNPKLFVSGSAELGFTDTRVDSIDTLIDIDQDLEKSGVDLNLGAGVSYIVLDKIGVGSRIAFGTGAYKTIQVGLDISFLF